MNNFTGSRKEFINTYGPFIHYITKGTGILAGTLAAQAILESSGNYNGVWSVGGSGLSRKANNFFGIKKGSNWNGPTINMQTGEQTPAGSTYSINSDFRVYTSVEDSIKDYVDLLTKSNRYKPVLYKSTVLDQAKALKAAGYATAVNYAQVVNSVYNSIANDLEYQKQFKYKPNKNKLFKVAVPLLIVIGSLYIAEKKGYLRF